MTKRVKLCKKGQSGFATAISSVLAFSIGISGLYLAKEIRNYKKEEVIKYQAQKTADRIVKIKKAISTYMAYHPNANTSSISCTTLVNTNLITPGDCKDAFGKPIQINNNNNNITINVQVPTLPNNDMEAYYGEVEKDVEQITNNNLQQQYMKQLL